MSGQAAADAPHAASKDAGQAEEAHSPKKIGAWERSLEVGAIAPGVRFHVWIDEQERVRLFLEVDAQTTEEGLSKAWRVVADMMQEEAPPIPFSDGGWPRDAFLKQAYIDHQRGMSYKKIAGAINAAITKQTWEWAMNQETPIKPFWGVDWGVDYTPKDEAAFARVLVEYFRLDPCETDMQRIQKVKGLGNILIADFYLRWMRPRLSLEDRMAIRAEIIETIRQGRPCRDDYPIHRDDVKERIRYFEKRMRRQ